MSHQRPGAFFRDPKRRGRVTRKANEKWRPVAAGILVIGGAALATDRFFELLLELASSTDPNVS